MRAKLSKQYIKGRGIEIGALHCPLPLFNGATVTHVDLMSSEELQAKFPEVAVMPGNRVVDNAEELVCFPKEDYDFVIANHVFEHCENPILAFKNWLRVLRPGGIIFAAIPDKDQCFDRKREVTTVHHIIRDYVLGPDQSAEEHYRDWFANSEIEGLKGQELEDRVAVSMRDRNNIHFHVWNEDKLRLLFETLWIVFRLSNCEIHPNGSELIVICQK